MANTILTPTMILREIMRHFYNNCRSIDAFNMEFQDQFTSARVRPGQVIYPRRPTNYTVSTGSALTVQDHIETVQPITLLPQRQIAVSFNRYDLTLNLQDFTERFTKQAGIAMANRFDVDFLNFAYGHTPWMFGVPGTTPTLYSTILDAEARLADEGVPDDGMKTCLLTPTTMAKLVDNTKGLFQDSSSIAKQYREGIIGRSIGMDWYRTQNLPVHTVGPLGVQGGGPQVNGAGQGLTAGWADFTDVNTKLWTASAATRLNKNDVISFAGVTATNLRNFLPFGVPRQFTVSSVTEGNVSSDGAGLAVVRVRPAIIAGGPYQNVTARPADSALITVVGSANAVSPQNLITHKMAYNGAIVPMEMPEGVHFAGAITDPKTGISMSLVRQYTISDDSIPCRLDMIYGFGVGERCMAVRLAA